MSGLVKVPASALKFEQDPAARSPVSRVTVRLDASRPEPAPSFPFVSVKVTEAVLKYGAVGPVSVIACPLGALVSSVSVIVSVAGLEALSVALMVRAPGSAAPADQL